MTTLLIEIPGNMRGKGRPRISARAGRPRAYTDDKTQNAESWARSCAVNQVGQPMLGGPLKLEMDIRVQIPESWSKKKKASALSGHIRPCGKPDIDNCAKLIADALNGIVWRDDSQIVAMEVAKSYGNDPVTTLRVTQLSGV